MHCNTEFAKQVLPRSGTDQCSLQTRVGIMQCLLHGVLATLILL